MNGYQQTENIGREKLRQFLSKRGVTSIYFTCNEFDRIDAFFKYNNKIVGVEIKNRNQKYEDYPTYIMEKQKLDYMDKLQENHHTYSCWMVYFFGQHVYIYKYRDIKQMIKNKVVKLESKLLPNSTVNKTKDIYKEIYLLPKTKALKYTL